MQVSRFHEEPIVRLLREQGLSGLPVATFLSHGWERKADEELPEDSYGKH